MDEQTQLPIRTDITVGKLFLSLAGRINRAKYLFTFISILLIGIILGLVTGIAGRDKDIGATGIVVAVFFLRIPFQAIQVVKRLHDLGRPGWHFFLLLIPLYNIYLTILLFFKKGQTYQNNYGADPLMEQWALKKPIFILSSLLLILVLTAAIYSNIESTKGPLSFILTNQDRKCQIALPSNWKSSSSLNKSAVIQATDYLENIGLIVISEDRRDTNIDNLNEYAEIVQQNLLSKIEFSKPSRPLELTIDRKMAIQIQIEGAVDRANIVYLVTVLETPSHYYQILTFAAPSKFEKEQLGLKEIIRSFKELR